MPATPSRLIRTLVAFLALFAAFATVAAPPSLPQTLHYQGYLTASSGAPVNASISMTFRLYAAPAGGSPVWSETKTVAVSNGVYDVELGSDTPLPSPFNVPYYLGVSVGADPEMTPRQPLASAPYAITAGLALEVGPGAVTEGSLGITCSTGQTLKYTVGVGWGCGSVECGPGTTLCAGTCIDVLSDRSNCGSCANACAAGQICSAGACAVTCQQGMTICSGTCVITASDNANCGACGIVCLSGRVCSAGACTLSCQSGLTNCNGMCRNLQTDITACGACGSACPSGTICSNGSCTVTCQSGLTNCNGVCRSVTTDNFNCGSCGRVCAAGTVCAGGVCALNCQAGLTSCNGLCANLLSDTNNCGACGHVCGAGTGCRSGVCS